MNKKNKGDQIRGELMTKLIVAMLLRPGKVYLLHDDGQQVRTMKFASIQLPNKKKIPKVNKVTKGDE